MSGTESEKMSEAHNFDYGLPTRIGIPIGFFLAVLWPTLPSAPYIVGDIIYGTPIHLRYAWNTIPLSAYTIVALVWIAGLYAQFYSATHKYSLRVTKDAIGAFILGIRWRQFEWGEISRIEKQRIYVGGQFGTITYIDIIKGSKRIRFYQSIEEFEKLVSVVNFYIGKFNTPVLFQDRGYDTVQAAKASTDKKEWRRLNKEGVCTSIEKL